MKRWQPSKKSLLEVLWNREFRFDWRPKVRKRGNLLTIEFLYALVFFEWGRP